MRDFLAATRERVLVYDGGMGATLEQFDLSLEDDYRLPGRCHEALVLNRPDVIEGVHASMLDAGADLRDVQIAARHADPRTTMRYDRARQNLDRHPNYILAAYMASGT